MNHEHCPLFDQQTRLGPAQHPAQQPFTLITPPLPQVPRCRSSLFLRMRDYPGESRLHVIEQAAQPGHAWQRIGPAHHLGQRDLRELLRTLDAGGKRHDMRPKGIGRDSLFQQGLQQCRHRSRQRTC